MQLHRKKYDANYYIPLFGIPIKNIINPLYITKLGNSLIVEVIINDEPKGHVEITGINSDENLLQLIRNFTYKLSNAVKFNYSIKVKVLNEQLLGYKALEYVRITSAITKSIIGNKLSYNILKSLEVIDHDLFDNDTLPLITSLRYSEIMNHDYLFRYNEGYIKAPLIKLQNVKVKQRRDLHIKSPEILNKVITHSAGLIPIKAFEFVEKYMEKEAIRKLIKLENALWEFIYNLPYVNEGKWVWDINSSVYITFSW